MFGVWVEEILAHQCRRCFMVEAHVESVQALPAIRARQMRREAGLVDQRGHRARWRFEPCGVVAGKNVEAAVKIRLRIVGADGCCIPRVALVEQGVEQGRVGILCAVERRFVFRCVHEVGIMDRADVTGIARHGAKVG